ncbi:MAG: hypothetical protein WC067_04985 [Candidatus Methanomethylophilaceae archaeon]
MAVDFKKRALFGRDNLIYILTGILLVLFIVFAVVDFNVVIAYVSLAALFMLLMFGVSVYLLDE